MILNFLRLIWQDIREPLLRWGPVGVLFLLAWLAPRLFIWTIRIGLAAMLVLSIVLWTPPVVQWLRARWKEARGSIPR